MKRTNFHLPCVRWKVYILEIVGYRRVGMFPKKNPSLAPFVRHDKSTCSYSLRCVVVVEYNLMLHLVLKWWTGSGHPLMSSAWTRRRVRIRSETLIHHHYPAYVLANLTLHLQVIRPITENIHNSVNIEENTKLLLRMFTRSDARVRMRWQ